MHFISALLDVQTIIQSLGLLGIFALVFAESGLFIGFFLPGDSLLFTAGFLASQHYFNIWWLLLGSIIAAIIGDSVGYAFGKKVGPSIFKREDSLLFHKDNVERSAIFFHKYGPKALILARFMPVVRTFIPILAGVGSMPYRRFFLYNSIGGFLWAGGVALLGFFLGRLIPNVDHYLLPIIIVIVIVSVIPSVWEFYKSKKKTESNENI